MIKRGRGASRVRRRSAAAARGRGCPHPLDAEVTLVRHTLGQARQGLLHPGQLLHDKVLAHKACSCTQRATATGEYLAALSARAQKDRQETAAAPPRLGRPKASLDHRELHTLARPTHKNPRRSRALAPTPTIPPCMRRAPCSMPAPNNPESSASPICHALLCYPGAHHGMDANGEPAEHVVPTQLAVTGCLLRPL